MPTDPQARFIGETIRPVAATFDTARMATGEPGLPRQFVWRGQTLEVAAELRSWRDTGPCDHGSGERYVRKHWHEVRLTSGAVATLYVERQARRGSRRQWRLFSLAGEGSGAGREQDA